MRRLVLIGLLLVAACARSELEIGESTSAPAPMPSPRPLPPPPPRCSAVRYDLCRAWDRPTVVSRAGEATGWPDVAWQGRVHLVSYEVNDEDASVLAAVDDDGAVRWRERLGPSSEPRVAWNPVLERGLVGMNEGLRWLGEDAVPVADFVDDSAFGKVSMNVDVAATPSGFAAIVSPTSDPGGDIQGTFARLEPAPSSVDWQVFYPYSPNPSIEHATGADGLVHRFGFEANVEFPDIQLLVFSWNGERPVGPTSPPYELGSGTNFTDGMVTDGATTYFLKSSSGVLAVIELDEAGNQQTHSLQLEDFDSTTPHMERLGTAGGLEAIVVADSRIVAGRMAVARFDPAVSQLDGAIDIGPAGDRPRIARTSRGLAVTWTDGDTRETLLNVLDCCVE